MTPAPLVFITGASSGIGQALALRFHRAGWRLALVARRGAELQAWADAQGLGADQARVYAADVCDLADIVAAGQACIAAQGLPDVVMANAGISVGVDTAERDDLEVMREHLRDQQPGHGRDLPPVRRADAPARQRHAGGHRQRGCDPRPAGAWRLLRQQGRRDQLLRKSARSNARPRRARW